MPKLTRDDYGGVDVRWTPDRKHAVCRIGHDAWQIREVNNGSPWGDLLTVVATLKAASAYLADIR